ncbi:hypothetical protein [Pseudoalteromonas arctica]|nr:hypothetical protein [Pseudoalteromonas arctica]
MPSNSLATIQNSSLAAQDYFLKSYERAAMSVELLSEKLRHVEGAEADAVRLTCVHSGRIILLVLADSRPGEVGISLANKGDEDAQFVEAVDENIVDSAFILKLLEANMSKGPKEI